MSPWSEQNFLLTPKIDAMRLALIYHGKLCWRFTYLPSAHQSRKSFCWILTFVHSQKSCISQLEWLNNHLSRAVGRRLSFVETWLEFCPTQSQKDFNLKTAGYFWNKRCFCSHRKKRVETCAYLNVQRKYCI